MKTLLLLFMVLFVRNAQAQNLYLGPIDVVMGPDIPHEEKWITGILSASNAFVMAVNIKQFKKTESRSNAGFLLFPGLIQLTAGSLFKKESNPTRKIDIAVGAASALICIGRLIYRPKNKARENVSLVPYYLPGKKGPAGGLALRLKIN